MLRHGAFAPNDDDLIKTVVSKAQKCVIHFNQDGNPEVMKELINLDDIANWLIAYGAKVTSDPLIANFISRHQLQMTLTGVQITKL